MGHCLNGAAEKITAPLFGYQVEIDFSGGEVGSPGQLYVDESFIMAQIEVGLPAVSGHKDFTVLIGRHGARIDVEVRVQLDDGDGDSPAFQDASDRCDADPFAQ